MYSSTNNAQYAQSHPHENSLSESNGMSHNSQMPMNLSLSQPIMPHPTYLQKPVLYTGQSQPQNPVTTPVYSQSAEQPWKTVSGKRGRKTEEQEILNENQHDYWLGGPIPTANRFISLSVDQMAETNKVQNQSLPQSSYPASRTYNR